jgi:hypothetical protein
MESNEMQEFAVDRRSFALRTFDDDVCPIDCNGDVQSPPHGIDLSKSLYHLRLHGFDVVSNDCISTPTRTFCKTPAVSPIYSCNSRQIGAPPETLPRMTCRPFVHDFLHDERMRNSTKMMENDEIKMVTPSTSPLGVDVNEDATMTFGKSHRRRLHSTTISNEGEDGVEVMLESSVSEDFEDKIEDCIKSSWDDCVHVSFIDQLPEDEFSIVPDCYSMTPQTPANVDFCGIPNWCDASTNQNIFLDDSSLPNGALHQRYDGWLCPQSAVCCGEQDAKLGLAKVASMQCMVQNHICMALGDGMDNLCWQQTTANIFHSYPMSSSNAPGDHPQKPVSTPEESMNKHRRSSNLPAYRRQNKFLSLRYNLNPFDDPGPTLLQRLHRPSALTKSQSFQQTVNQRQPVSNRSHSRSSQLPDSSDWECGALDFALVYEDEQNPTAQLPPLNLSTSSQRQASQSCADNGDGYESDPEFAHRAYHIERFDSMSQVQHSDSNPSTTMKEFLNERCTFIWHSSCSRQNKSIAVHVWVERGQQLYDSLVLPKLCWKPILPQNLNADDCRSQNRVCTLGGNVSSIELLDICRILPLDKRDSERFPFAVTQRLFSIEATSNNFELKQYFPQSPSSTSIILEARSIADRIRYMNLLKLTVSTLAAKFLTNDPSTLVMFFHGPSITSPVE